MPYIRTTDCKHPTITDEELVEREIFNAESFKCPDCDEYLYPHGDPEDDEILYVGEPYGAGRE